MDRYSFTGKGNILIRANTSGTYGGKNYDTNEPIAYFTDVLVSLNFFNTNKTARQGTSTLAVDSKSEPSLLRVDNIKINESLQSLLYKKNTDSIIKNRTRIERVESLDGVLALSVTTQEELLNEIFIYDANKVRQLDYVLNNEDNIIEGLVDGFYTVFYMVQEAPYATFFLENNTIPYVAAEISLVGNLNGDDADIVLRLNKLSLLSQPTLDFNSESPFAETLEFAVISDSKNPAEVNYYEQNLQGF